MLDDKRARIFIGSSTESKRIADAIQDNLIKDHDVEVWDQDIFALGENQLDSLIRAAKRFDFAIFIAFGDDTEQRRGRDIAVPRDNVVLEVGLFMGALGRERVFVVAPDDAKLVLPSDLAGITFAMLRFTEGQKLVSAVAPLSRKISARVEEFGVIAREEQDASLYVAAVVYRVADDGLEILLVRSSRGRWIFPKGKVLPGESSSVAAIRYAEDEGGVSGRPEILETIQFRHLKEDAGCEQKVVAQIIRFTREFSPDEKFRVPRWFTIHDAEAALKEGRSGRYTAQYRDVLLWASAIISRCSTDIRKSVGVIAIRKTEGGGLSVLLISSINHQNWVIPKGRCKEGESHIQAAKREALEEAGITGLLTGDYVGQYEYTRLSVQHVVQTFLMLDIREHSSWPEQSVRERRWFPIDDAKRLVHEAALSALIAHAADLFEGRKKKSK